MNNQNIILFKNYTFQFYKCFMYLSQQKKRRYFQITRKIELNQFKKLKTENPKMNIQIYHVPTPS